MTLLPSSNPSLATTGSPISTPTTRSPRRTLLCKVSVNEKRSGSPSRSLLLSCLSCRSATRRSGDPSHINLTHHNAQSTTNLPPTGPLTASPFCVSLSFLPTQLYFRLPATLCSSHRGVPPVAVVIGRLLILTSAPIRYVASATVPLISRPTSFCARARRQFHGIAAKRKRLTPHADTRKPVFGLLGTCRCASDVLLQSATSLALYVGDP